MDSREELLQIYSDPQLKAPYLLAAGPGTSNVGLRTVKYLREKLNAELFAEIAPGDFFMPPYSFTFREGIIEISPIEAGEHIPHNRFYYWKSGGEHDIMFFTGNTAPLPGKVPELAEFILDAARRFGLTRLYMPGAFLTDIYHSHEPAVYASVTEKYLQDYLAGYSIAPSPPMNIAHNLSAWLLGMSKWKGIEAIGLVGEIPAYNPEGRNIRACRELVRLLVQMLDIDLPDLSDLDEMLEEEEEWLENRLTELNKSSDSKISDFVKYLEMLKSRERTDPKDRQPAPPVDIELPDSLKFIEELYLEARRDPGKIGELKEAIEHMNGSDRLLILRKYGDRIMSLLGYRM
jgi:proteasome assembly chaperone (PAC2) family protein